MFFNPSSADIDISNQVNTTWLLMPRLLASPGHQQQWYWLCIMHIFLSSLGVNFINLWLFSADIWYKMGLHFYVSQNKFSITQVNVIMKQTFLSPSQSWSCAISSKPSDTYMFRKNKSSLVQIMPCRLNAGSLLIGPLGKISAKFESKNNFHSRIWNLKYCLQSASHFVSASMCYLINPTWLYWRKIVFQWTILTLKVLNYLRSSICVCINYKLINIV